MPLNRSLMWPLGLLGATIVGAFAYYAYMGWALGHDMCGAKIEERLVSPDSAYEAVVYEFNCGATTSFTGVVGIAPPGRDPLKTTSVFRVEGRPTRLDHGSYGGPINALFRVRWLAPREIQIRYPEAATLLERVDRASGVSISYVVDR